MAFTLENHINTVNMTMEDKKTICIMKNGRFSIKCVKWVNVNKLGKSELGRYFKV